MFTELICGPHLTPVRDTSGQAHKGPRQKRAYWEQKILALLGPAGTAMTTRQMAGMLGCHPNNLTAAVLHLRRTDQIVAVAKGIDPDTGHKAYYYALAHSTRAMTSLN